VHNDVQRIRHVRFNRTVRQFNSTLQNATRKPSQTLLCGARMYGRERAGVTRI
jgi:hypothetical protein